MTATCYPVPKTVAQDMIQGVVHAICDRPGQTAAQREALARQVVSSIMAFAPRDPVEIMLAGTAVANFHLIMDQTHGAFAETTDLPRSRVNSGIVALERATTGLLKEIRIAQNRPLEDAAEAPRTDARAEPVAAAAPKTAADARQTTASQAPNRGTAASREDAAPVPLLPPLREAGTSVAAMQAAGPPPLKPPVVNAGSKQVSAASSVGARAFQHAGAGASENGLPGLLRMVGTLRTTPEVVPVAGPGV